MAVKAKDSMTNQDEFPSICVAFWMGAPDLRSIIDDPASSLQLVDAIKSYMENRRCDGTTTGILADDILMASAFAHVAHTIAEHFRAVGDEKSSQWYFAAGQELMARQIGRLESLAVALSPKPRRNLH